MALLATLVRASGPLSADELSRRIAGKLDRVNVYRSLDALVERKLVGRVDVGHRHMHYESIALTPQHRHHYVCADCGARVNPHV